MVRVEFADGSEETFETRDCVYSPWGNSLSGDGIRLISVNAGGSIPPSRMSPGRSRIAGNVAVTALRK